MTVATWIEDVNGTLDLLLGGAVAKLQELSSNPPAGADVFEAWNSLSLRMGLETKTDPVAAAAALFPDDRNAADAAANVMRALVRALGKSLDDGLNDEANPHYRERDLPKVARIAGGAFGGWRFTHVDRVTNWASGDTPGLPSGHKLRDLEPFTLADGTRVLLLAPPGDSRSWFRFSRIVAATAAGVRHQRREQAQVEEQRRREQEERLIVAQRLEAQAAQLRESAVALRGTP